LRAVHSPNGAAGDAPPSRAAAADPVPFHAVLAVLAIALPLLLIRHLSLWFDELFSVYFAAQGPDYLLHEGWALETTPPLYYLFLWVWTELFGRGEAAVRSLSLLCHALTLPVVYATARKLDLGAGSSWRAVVLYALGATTVDYAVMARSYALWTLLLALAVLALASALRAPATSEGERRLLTPAIGFAATTVAALYVHNMAIIFAAAGDLVFLAWGLQRGRSWRGLGVWLAPQAAALVIATPQLLVIATQARSPNIDWIPGASGINALAVAFDLLGGPGYPLMLLRTAASVLVFGLFVWGGVAAIRRAAPAGGIAALVVLAFGLLYLVSLWRPLMLARSLAWALVPVAIVAAAAFDRIGRLVPRLAAFAVFAGAVAANSGFGLWLSTQEPWREVVAVIAANHKPGDVVVVMDQTPIAALLYYAPGTAAWNLRHWTIKRAPEASAVRKLEDRIAPVPTITPREMAALLQQGHGVWLVSRLPSEIPYHEAFDTQALLGMTPAIRIQRGFILASRLAQAGH